MNRGSEIMDIYRSQYEKPFPKTYRAVDPGILPDNALQLSPSSPGKKNETKAWIYRRNMIAVLSFFGFFCAYMLRTNLSVSVVAMTKIHSHVNETGIYNTQDFYWDLKEKGSILGAFFYGYVFTQIIGGWLSGRIGGAKVFGTGILITAFIDLLIPICSQFGILAIVFLRVSQGFFQGATYPSMHAVWSRWAPPKERTRLATVSFSGGFMGTMLTFPLCGYLATTYGWTYTFYVPGLLTCLWAVIWFFGVRDEPANDPWISTEELDYLRSTLGHSNRKDIKHPWLSFILSMPVWAIIVSHFCENWGFYTMFTMLPTFLTETVGFSVYESSIYSAVPFLLMSVGLPIAGLIVDAIRRWEHISTTRIRKIFNCGAFFLQFIFMLLTGFVSDATYTMVFIILAIGFGAFAWAAFGVNHLDIAPPHAGILMGMSNMMATFAGILSPPLTGYLVVHKTREEWNWIFFISSGIYLFGAIFYMIFGSGEQQSWVKEDVEDEHDTGHSMLFS